MRNKYRGQDIRARLENTIIRYNGKPYLVGVDGEIIILYDIITKAIIHRKNPDDPGLDVSSIDLGYVNINEPRVCAVYLKRNPIREYKQGINLRSLEYDALTLPKHRFGVGSDMMQCQGFLDSYNGNFPTLKEGIKRITIDGGHSVALNKDVALLRDVDILKVYFKQDEVGWIRVGTNKVTLPKTETSWVTLFNLNLIDGWEVVEGV